MFFITFFLSAILLASLVSAETIVTTLVGAAVSFGLTNFIKQQVGVRALGAFVLAAVVAFVIAVAAQGVQLFLGGEFSIAGLINSGASIFATATIAYNAITAGKQ